MIEVSGGAVSITQRRLAGVGSLFPAASVARTRNSCAPATRGPYSRGEVQGANAAASSEHSSRDPGSLPENAKLALWLLVGSAGPDSIAVSGGVTSIVHAYDAGLGSLFPAASVARTWKVWVPGSRSA